MLAPLCVCPLDTGGLALSLQAHASSSLGNMIGKKKALASGNILEGPKIMATFGVDLSTKVLERKKFYHEKQKEPYKNMKCLK